MKRVLSMLLVVLLLCGALGVAEEAEVAPGLTGELEPPAEEAVTEEEMPIVEDEPVEEAGRLAGIRIGIDPGHQEKGNNEKEAIAPGSKEKKPKVSSGTRGRSTGIPEYITVLEIAMKLRDSLRAEGAEVYMTRETHDVNISNQERARLMNDLGVDLVLRIHCDGVDKKSVNGIGLYVNKTGPIAAASDAAAKCILPRMLEATGANKRGIFYRDTYTGLNWSTVPCILVECGYMTNADEDVKLNTPDYQQKLAEGMVEGICDYFGR